MEKKSEVIAAIAEGAGLTQAQASAAMDAYAAAALAAGSGGLPDQGAKRSMTHAPPRCS